jgi:hypothetical protein
VVQTEVLTHHVRRRLSEQLDGVIHGSDGSLDKLLMTWVEPSRSVTPHWLSAASMIQAC